MLQHEFALSTPQPSCEASGTTCSSQSHLRHLFSVPLWNVQLDGLQLDTLERIILQRHDAMAANLSREAASANWVQHASLNDRFFEAQQQWDVQWHSALEACTLRGVAVGECNNAADAANDWAEMRTSRAFKEVRTAIWREVRTYLAASGVPPKTVDQAHVLHTWAGVHKEGVWHTPHTHFSTLASGTLYITAPSHSGRVVFQDPRQAHAQQQVAQVAEHASGSFATDEQGAFDRGLALSPVSGLLVIFPPWLGHFVERTAGRAPRVSLSFNVVGSWTPLARASVTGPKVHVGSAHASSLEAVSTQCSLWAQTGECESNPNFMKAECASSCAESPE